MAAKLETKVYDKAQRNRLKSRVVGPAVDLIRDMYTPYLDAFGLVLPKGHINCDVALPGSNLQNPHWDRTPPRKRFLFLTIPLVDMTVENGCLQVWPCTQKLYQITPVPSGLSLQYQHRLDVSGLEAVNCEYPKGTVIIRDPYMLHRGTTNNTRIARPCLTLICHRRSPWWRLW